MCVVMMPISLKVGIDAIITNQNHTRAVLAFAAYGVFNVLSTYFDGLKGYVTTKVIQTAWYKISLQAYNKLLALDLWAE